ncbi:MAG: hypothetical protein J5594_00070 [Elusimicrobiaceae bacterium]|nr:hypothetical protein [Elusimicrobiaceae bacterium]
MKQLLFLLVLGIVGYFVLWGGTTSVVNRADMNPKKLITNIAASIDEDVIPEIDSSRNKFRYTDQNSFKRIKENAFMNYDSDLCASVVDLAYSSGYKESGALIKEYFATFVSSNDINKVLRILSSYKDKQTLKLLLETYNNENITEKASFLRALSAYHTPEVAKIIKEATLNEEDLVLAETAKKLETEFAEKKWYIEGLKAVSDNSGNGIDLDIGVNKNHLGQQYHNGSDFESKMAQY